MSTLKQTLTDALKTAMKARESDRITVLRGLQAAIKQIEIDTRTELDNSQVLAVLDKQLKQRKESIVAYTNAKRSDLATQEQFEHDVILQFMPAQLNSDELTALVAASIAEQNATSIKDMGKVMNAIRPHIAGKADPAVVSSLIKAQLGK